MAGELYVQSARILDEELAESREKDRFVLKEVRERKILTMMGPVTLKRRYYHDEKEDRHCALLDEALELESRTRLSPALRDVGAKLATDMSYGQAARVLKTILGERFSRQSIWNAVQMFGETLKEETRAACEALFEHGRIEKPAKDHPECLFGEVDGCVISLQRQLMRKAEMKVGVWYEGWQKKPVAREEYELVHKRYVASGTSARDLWERMTVEGQRRYGLSEVPHVYAGGDGASWIKAGASWMGAERFKVDGFHLKRLLSRAFGFEGLTRVVGQLQAGQHDDAMKTLAGKAIAEPDEGKREQMAKAMHWVMEQRGNLERIVFPKKEKSELLWRQLGTMERHADLVVAERFKKRGMSWSPDGAENLLLLRVRKLNGEWPETWQPKASAPQSVIMENRPSFRKPPLPIVQAGLAEANSAKRWSISLKRVIQGKVWE